MTRILVTGGTGVLGSQLVPLLVRDGHIVRILSRSPRRAGYDDRIEWAQAEIETGHGLAQALAGVDTIAHLATSAFRPQQVDVQGTETLLRHAREAGVGHFVYISIAGIEHIPFSYYKAKLQAERLIEKGGVPWTILRATQFHSLMPRLFLLPAIRTPLIAPVPESFRFQLIDESEAAVRLAELIQGEPAGRVADIGGPQVLTLGVIARAYLRAAGLRKPVVNLPLTGRVAAGFRQGYNARALPYGTITWDDWLARTYGASHSTQPRSAPQTAREERS
jgi:uncharacterized protein YbjT (DUF2867 family)